MAVKPGRKPRRRGRDARFDVRELKEKYLLEPVIEMLGGEVLSSDVSPSGWTRVRCPGHDDKRASAALSPDGDRLTCAGCGLQGDVFDIVRELVEGVDDFRGAVAWVEKHVAPISFTTDS